MDEECAFSSADFSSKIQHLFSPVGVGAPTTRNAPSSADLSSSHLCLLLRVAKRHEGTEFHSGGVKEPECARAAARQGDRGAVDEE